VRSPCLRVCVKTPHRVHISRVGNASTTMGRGYATLFSSFHTDSYARGYNSNSNATGTAPRDRALEPATGYVAPRVSKGKRLRTCMIN
jgi:hypothetical protein